jgi:hypothetical protein
MVRLAASARVNARGATAGLVPRAPVRLADLDARVVADTPPGGSSWPPAESVTV